MICYTLYSFQETNICLLLYFHWHWAAQWISKNTAWMPHCSKVWGSILSSGYCLYGVLFVSPLTHAAIFPSYCSKSRLVQKVERCIVPKCNHMWYVAMKFADWMKFCLFSLRVPINCIFLRKQNTKKLQ